MKFESNKIKLNQEVKGVSSQDHFSFFELQLDSNQKNMDLLIDSKTLNSKTIYESPIVMISPKPLKDSKHSDLWVCGQLGNETCLIPSNKINDLKVLFVGVACDNCQFTLSASFVNESILKDGENQVFHLRKGDKVIFKLDDSFNLEKKQIKINSFNMRMTPYNMEVEMIEKSEGENILKAEVHENWFGGQQAILKPSAGNPFENFNVRIIFTAVEDGVFNVEAKSSNSLSRLNDKSLKFETVAKDFSNCYAYNIPQEKQEDELVFEIKSIKGDLEFYVFPDNKNLNDFNDFNNEKLNKFITSKGYLENQSNKKIVLDAKLRNKQNFGEWKICIRSESQDETMYTIQGYLASNHHHIKEYQKLLYNILKNDEMYSIHNIQLKEKKETPLLRILAEVESDLKDSVLLLQTQKEEMANTNSTAAPVVKSITEDPVYIHINGIGVGGIAVGFLFTFVILIGLRVMMVIFVNTKTIYEPLRMGRIEY
jgi:hypothetical protein